MVENTLYYGDNLDILQRRIATESVDLVYLDPPFNSKKSYNVLFGDSHGRADQAQIQAFGDTWKWTPETERLYFEMLSGEAPAHVAEAIHAIHELIGEGDVMAYLTMMTPRLVQLYRVLKPTGSLYLHADPTASHYLKIILDTIFEARNFRNEIVWKRTSAHSDIYQGARHLGRVHDVIFYYSKGEDPTWNPVFLPYSSEYIERIYRYVDANGRRYQTQPLHAKQPGGDTRYEWKGQYPPPGRYWAFSKKNMQKLEDEGRIVYSRTGVPRYKIYLDESAGRPLQDWWDDIAPVHSIPSERLPYPTQKPLALLQRIINLSSDEGDVVLDPFCGCGTAVVAAQALKRKWIGIDVTYIAVDLMQRRLRDAFGTSVGFRIDGIPRDVPGAEALFNANAFDFERWAVSLVYGQPNEKQVGDKGFDGIIRFPLGGKDVGRALVSVKGGRQLGPHFVRDLIGTIKSQKAELGVLVTLATPTRGMVDAANHAGTYKWSVNGQTFPKAQLVTIEELLSGKRPTLPPALTPYLQAKRQETPSQQMTLGAASS